MAERRTEKRDTLLGFYETYLLVEKAKKELDRTRIRLEARGKSMSLEQQLRLAQHALGLYDIVKRLEAGQQIYLLPVVERGRRRVTR